MGARSYVRERGSVVKDGVEVDAYVTALRDRDGVYTVSAITAIVDRTGRVAYPIEPLHFPAIATIARDTRKPRSRQWHVVYPSATRPVRDRVHLSEDCPTLASALHAVTQVAASDRHRLLIAERERAELLATVPAAERCTGCGQPDNTGDCNHEPIPVEDLRALLG